MTQPTTSEEWDVIVMGAGLSGLTAAYHLTKTIPGCKVLVLEAKDRVGGRTLTIPMQGVNGPDDWDLGGQWVCRTQHHVLWLLKELGIEQYPQFCEGTKLQQAGDDHRISSYETEIPSLPIHVLFDILNFQRKANKLANQVSCDAPWKSASADCYDNITFETFLARTTWTKGAKDVVESGFEVVNGSRGRGHSALNYLFYIHSGISNQSLYDNKDGGAQENKINGGAQPMSKKIVERLGQSNVILSEPVVSIDQSAETGKVKIQTSSGKTFNCKYVISSIPMNCTESIQYSPDPPVKRLVLASHMRMGNLFKFIVTYKRPFWREKGYSGEILNFCSQSVSEGGPYAGPLLYVSDAASASNSPALVGFINNSVYWGESKFEARKEAILNHLADFFGAEAKSPVDYCEKDWSKEPYAGGCPVNMMMTGAGQYWDAIREPFGRIHWAGTETATHWMGYLSGAVQSGLRAADEVTARLDPQRNAKSDLLRSLDGLGAKDRSSKSGHGLWWTLGKVTMGVALIGAVIGQAWMYLQRN